MRVLAVTFQDDAGPGVFGEATLEYGGEVSEWLAPEEPRPTDLGAFDAVMVLGASQNPDQAYEYPWLADVEAVVKELLDTATPLMGLCLGGQMIAQAAGTPARRAPAPEIGWLQLDITSAGREDPLFGPLAPRFEAFAWHGYEFTLPPTGTELARSNRCLHACRVGDAAWALQFHPEASRADTLRWIDGYEIDPDAVSVGLDAAALRAESEPKLDAFNQLGRDLCHRWLDFAASRRGAQNSGTTRRRALD